MKILSGLPDGYQDKDVEEFVELLQDAIDRLDTLAQIQAAAGGISMQAKSGNTFELATRLEMALGKIQSNRGREYKRMWREKHR